MKTDTELETGSHRDFDIADTVNVIVETAYRAKLITGVVVDKDHHIYGYLTVLTSSGEKIRCEHRCVFASTKKKAIAIALQRHQEIIDGREQRKISVAKLDEDYLVPETKTVSTLEDDFLEIVKLLRAVKYSTAGKHHEVLPLINYVINTPEFIKLHSSKQIDDWFNPRSSEGHYDRIEFDSWKEAAMHGYTLGTKHACSEPTAEHAEERYEWEKRVTLLAWQRRQGKLTPFKQWLHTRTDDQLEQIEELLVSRQAVIDELAELKGKSE